MNKNAIKKYAIWARRELIDRVSKKAMRYGISPDGAADPDAFSVDGRLLSDTEQRQRRALIARVAAHGYAQTMEEAAYTWFNRLTALRFMEVNGYLPSHVRVFTDDAGAFRPQILTEAIHLELPGLDMEQVYALKEANDEEALYRCLLIVQCNALNDILPGMFQRLGNVTELLLPDNLLREGSVIERLVRQGDAASIPEEDWRDQVQIIGWLYQYYNTEPKENAFANLKKNIKVTKETLPAATQLFTPDWIVRYMVENSLGRLWLEGHPNDTLQRAWKYYLPEAEQEASVQQQLAAIRKEYTNIRPEDIRCIDPCMGSGHILCYMFDVLMQIYEDYGYTAREAAASIVEHNLYGLDIDDRAAQLAYFAVMMKARQYDRRFFSRGIQPHVMAIEESNGLRTWTEAAGDSLVAGQLSFEDDLIRMADTLIETFQDAKEYGSILTVRADHYDALADFIEKARQEAGNLLFRAWIDEVAQRILPLIQQATWLAAKYDIVVTNPPYAGAKGLNNRLKTYINNFYEAGKADIFATFIIRCGDLSKSNGFIGLITPDSFFYNPSYTVLRKNFVESIIIVSAVELGKGAFESGFGTVMYIATKTQSVSKYIASFFDVSGKEEKTDFLTTKIFLSSSQYFSNYSSCKFMYKLNRNYRAILDKATALSDICAPKIGMQTNNNNRFLRQWYEISAIKFCSDYNGDDKFPSKKWFPMVKGGGYRKWYGNICNVVNWENNGIEIRQANIGAAGGRIVGEEYYFREGLTWTHTTYSQPFSIRVMPKGTLINVEGPAIFNFKTYGFYILACLNSVVGMDIFKKVVSSIHYAASELSRFPLIISPSVEIDILVQENISISRTDWDSFETSWDFVRHPLLAHPAPTLAAAYEQYRAEANARFDQLKANEEELNRIFIDIYGLADELTPAVEERDVTVQRIFDTKEDIPASMRGSNYAITRADVVRSLISYAVGCMFGRYSLDTPGLAYAGGDWDGGRYTTFLPDEDGIIPICDNEYFDDDIVERFAAFLAATLGAETLEENLQFVADALGTGGSPREVIRSYFLTTFYADHVKTYQKRPIYWLFDSGTKNGFKCLVYMHRYDPNTLARIRTDYVHEQQSRYRTAISNLEEARDHAVTAADRVSAGKKLASVIDREKELLAYEEKIHHLADQRLTIDLDDGVKHNYAIFQDVLAKIK